MTDERPDASPLDGDVLRTLTARIESMLAEESSASSGNGGGVAVLRRQRDGVLQFVLTELRGHVPYDSASIQELRDNRLVIVGGVGFADLDVIIGESFDIFNADTPNGEVIHRRRPYIVRDTEHYRAFRRGLHVGADIRSWLGVPLLASDSAVGMIAFDKKEPDFFTPRHQGIAMQFARVAADVIRARTR